MNAFVTGSAGFIGFHLALRLLENGHTVTGYDGMTDYYDPALKHARVEILTAYPAYTHIEAMLEDAPALETALDDSQPEIVIHLAAQAGVRYSLEHPEAYISSNIVGTFNLIQALRERPLRHLLIASTSSVYGGNTNMPFREHERADFPVSLYAATKKSCEAMSHSYSHLFGIPTTCFRFFTVYGPWGRPDMALFKFVENIETGKPIDVYGHGQMKRDFTYIDDLITAIVDLFDAVPEVTAGEMGELTNDSLSPVAPWRVVNIAGGQPVELMDFIQTIEQALKKDAIKNYLPMQAGDVMGTHADAALLDELTGHRPATPLATGVQAFIDWYHQYRATA